MHVRALSPAQAWSCPFFPHDRRKRGPTCKLFRHEGYLRNGLLHKLIPVFFFPRLQGDDGPDVRGGSGDILLVHATETDRKGTCVVAPAMLHFTDAGRWAGLVDQERVLRGREFGLAFRQTSDKLDKPAVVVGF